MCRGNITFVNGLLQFCGTGRSGSCSMVCGYVQLYILLDEISNVPPDGEASGPEAAGETPLCSDQETARSESSNQAHMQLCWSSTQNKFVFICPRFSFNNTYKIKCGHCQLKRRYKPNKFFKTKCLNLYIVNLFSFSFLTFFFCCFITF
jgi:hypothetical protein